MSGYVHNIQTGESVWVESTPEELAAIPVPTQQQQAQAAIDALEYEQVRRLTRRGDREFRLAVYQALSALPGLGALANHPAFLALKALDDAIKVERAKL